MKLDCKVFLVDVRVVVGARWTSRHDEMCFWFALHLWFGRSQKTFNSAIIKSNLRFGAVSKTDEINLTSSSDLKLFEVTTHLRTHF